MFKFLGSFKFEIIFFLIGLVGAIVVIILRHYDQLDVGDEVEIAITLMVAVVPLFLVRLESILSEQKEALALGLEKGISGLTSQVQRMLTHCEEAANYNQLIMLRREIAVSSGFLTLLERIPQHVANCGPVLEQIEANIRDISEGRYPITKADAVYLHDSRRINLLNEGDFYWATWSANANPKSLADIGPESVAFTAYISAQKDAVSRGVQVVRLYILQNVANLPPKLSKHLQELKKAGISIRLVGAEQLRDSDLCEDFVIIGRHVVGIGEPARGPMERSVYYFNLKGNIRPEYQRYQEFFTILRQASAEYAE